MTRLSLKTSQIVFSNPLRSLDLSIFPILINFITKSAFAVAIWNFKKYIENSFDINFKFLISINDYLSKIKIINPQSIYFLKLNNRIHNCTKQTPLRC